MKRSHPEHLAGEHRLTDIGQAVLCVIFLAVWLTDLFFGYSVIFNTISLWIKLPVGIAFLLLSGYMAWTGLAIVFGKGSKHEGVIRQGVFGFVRHPIYLSEIILYVGLLIMVFSVASALALLAGMVFFHYIARSEEKLLLVKFGKKYEKYQKDVPMWFPRLKK